mgnify:CR=1 FL=1
MGRVFRYEQLVDGAAPEPSDFSAAGQTFVESAQQSIDRGVVDGAFIFGSFAIDNVNMRSDFDALVSTNDSSPQTYSEIHQLVTNVREASNFKIPMGIITYPRECLAEGRHEMDRYFGHHLSGKDRLIIGSDPADYIEYPDASSRDVVGRYIFSKRRVLSNAYTALTPEEAIDDGGLQRMLELPTAIGRKVVHAVAENGEVEDMANAYNGSDKLAIELATREILDQTGLSDGFNCLLNLNQGYSELVRATASDEVSRKDYNDYISLLHGSLVNAISWLDELGKELLPDLDKTTTLQS